MDIVYYKFKHITFMKKFEYVRRAAFKHFL